MATEVNVHPLTGAEYLESLRDGRELYIDGERVADVTTHPAFRNSARSVARLYDALHDPATQETLMMTDRLGIRTHKFFAPSYTVQELVEAREAIATWSRLSYGWMGRTPDYKAAFMASLGAAPDFYAPYTENAKRWYKDYAEKVLFLNHVLVNPPVDRHKPIQEVGDVFVHVVKETDGVAQNSAVQMEKGKAEDFALVFLVPMNAPGQKLVCRTSYEKLAKSPFDNPLSSRFDENDSVVIFDKVFIPWENVLVYRDVQKATSFYAASGFINRYQFQANTRLCIKLDFMCGLLAKGLVANGTDPFRGNQAMLGEVVAWRDLIWAVNTAMTFDTEPGPGGCLLPNINYVSAARLFATLGWPRIKEIFELILGGSPLVIPSSYKDMESEELRPYIDRYYRGSDSSAEDRIKLFKLIWETIGTEYGGRHELYERNYSGNHEQVRIDTLNFARRKGLVDSFTGLVDQCMSDYDVHGWTKPTWQFDKA